MKLVPLLISCLLGCVSLARAQQAIVPAHRSVHTLAAADTPEAPYLAFPVVLDLGNEVLVSFKSGRSHAADSDATQEWLRLDKATGRKLAQGTLAALKGEIMQMGEWVRFANGDIANYIDAQQATGSIRSGLCVVRSTDGGRTFGPVQRVGVVDGVEYGYAFDAITRDRTTWMLAMTFANLTGGKLVHKTRSQPGSVDVIRSNDNGRTWRFVRSITNELNGAPINESAFIAHADGFIVAARGYDQHQWLLLTDGDFKLKRKVDLASTHSFIKSVIGRPRVFARDGGYYLLARNFIGPDATGVAPPVKNGNPMRLSLFKFDPETLLISKHVLLDNAEGENVTDGYYAMPYWQERAGRTYFNTITYKGIAKRSPDIIRLEFDWEEVR